VSWPLLWPFVLFAAGVRLVIWATERLLEWLVGPTSLVRVSVFAIAAILSGFEAENVAVDLGIRRGASEIALATIFSLRVNLPQGFLVLIKLEP
jgi:hypothetical protein